MLTQAQIHTEVTNLLGSDLAALLDTSKTTRWFNEGQARLGWFKTSMVDVTWDADDNTIDFAEVYPGVEEILFPDATNERRWEPTVGGLIIRDYEGATEAGSAKVVVHTYWPEVTGAVSSSLPTVGDSACISYALHRAYRFFVSDRSIYQRYATMAGQNAVGIEDLARAADDHYRDFLDLRADLPEAPAATFFS